jgi:predicted ATPase
MFRRLEVRHYKSLRRVDVPLEALNILVGPNASGKSTALDVFAFLKDALERDVEYAVRARGRTLAELVWKNEDVADGFEFAVEMDVPAALAADYPYRRVRYALGVGLDADGAIAVRGETLVLLATDDLPVSVPDAPDALTSTDVLPEKRFQVFKKWGSGTDHYRAEFDGWETLFRRSPHLLALSGVPEDMEKFPITLWFRDALRNSVQLLQLNTVLMRRPSPWDAVRRFLPDGSNLPVIVRDLQTRHAERFGWWLDHLKTTLDDLENVLVRERPEDRSLYLVVVYRGGLEVPAWLLSDGTLRLLALTLIAYLPEPGSVYMIEEPENGVHPKVIEAVYQSLSSVYDGQVFLATHSPLFLGIAKPDDLLIFARTEGGASAIVRGSQHPALNDWRRDLSLGTLFASGVLG